jgi:GT2 family glycosyltransferase
MTIRISLVFPLCQERGTTTESLRAWARQTLPAERYEMIVVANESVVVDPVVIAQLRPHDRLVRGQFANLAHQFDAGVRAGSGEFLFLTESHCLPAPNCLDAMDRFLAANPHLAGACCESVPAWENAYQRIDATTFEEGYRLFLRINDWRKLSVHGMALRRDLFLALGGLQHHFGRFAEMLLAAALRDAGHELGYARESVVTHHYRDSLQELIDGTAEYVMSECQYRAANPGPDRVGHTYLPEMPNPFSPGAAALNRAVAATLWDGAFGRKTILMRTALAATARSVAGRFGRWGPVLGAWLALLTCRIRCWWNRNDAARLDVPYRELIRLTSVLSRSRFLSAQPVIDPPPPEWSRAMTLDQFPAWALHGFHEVERVNGEPFRWTGRVAALRLSFPKGRYQIRLVTRGVRREGMNLQVAFNGVRIEPEALATGDYELPIERWHCLEREQTLMLVSAPLCPWKQGVKDYRELGLPLFAVEAIPMTANVGKPRRAAA